MKKIFTLSLFLLATIAASAQMRYLRGQFGGNQVVPVTTSTAVGVIVVKYNTVTKMLQEYANYRGLSSAITDAHIHSGAIGENGPTIITLTNSGGTDGTLTGSVVLTAAQEADLLAGKFYTDVHSAAFPSGEVRAQLSVTTDGQTDFYSARLQGAQVDPPNNSTAIGTVYAIVDKVTHRLYLTGSFTGLSAAASTSDIHDGSANTTGSPVFSVVYSAGISGTLNTTKAVTDAQIISISSGNYYVDIHNSTYPSGEIRGQLTMLNQLYYFGGDLTGAKQVPAAATAARGTVIAYYNSQSNQLVLTGDYQNLSSNISASHIHGPATPTTNAPVLYDVTNTGSTMGTLNASVTILQAQEADLLAGNMYVNVHSANFPGGEIRTQLMPTTSGQSQYITGKMTADQSVATPAVMSSATGTTTVLLDRFTRNVFVTGSYSGLTSGITNSHIHRGAAGTNGPVSIQLQFVAGTLSGTVTGTATGISESLADSIIRGFSYLNIHTANYPAGEIRAQLGDLVLPVKLSYFNGYKDHNTVALIWESAQEINVKSYEVEQLNQETGEWIKKGTVAATGGSTTAKYRFDDMPSIGTKEYILYRLKMVDLQGTVTYSSIIRINYLQTKAALTLLANPVVNGTLGFTVSGMANNNQKAEISIIDFSGRIVHKQSASTLLNNFVNVSSLSKGMYKLVVKTNNTVLQETFSRQ
jgi:Cu/Zn superoxide dismutase